VTGIALVASITESLAWPMTFLVAVALLRTALVRLIPQLNRFSYGDLEAEFGERVNALQRPAAATAGADAERWQRDMAVERDLAEVAPNAAVLEAWMAVEAAARRLLRVRGHAVEAGGDTPYLSVERALDRDAGVSRQTTQLFRELRQLRNRVAHAAGFTVRPPLAKQYVLVARALADSLHDASDNDEVPTRAGEVSVPNPHLGDIV
jgi:hypothetical protein